MNGNHQSLILKGAFKVVDKSWGREYWIVGGDLYGMKIIDVNPHFWSSEGKFHYHKEKDETFLVLKRRLFVEVDVKGFVSKYCLGVGEKLRIPPGVMHRFRCVSDRPCRFMEVSTSIEKYDSFYDTAQKSQGQDLPSKAGI